MKTLAIWKMSINLMTINKIFCEKQLSFKFELRIVEISLLTNI